MKWYKNLGGTPEHICRSLFTLHNFTLYSGTKGEGLTVGNAWKQPALQPPNRFPGEEGLNGRPSGSFPIPRAN